MSGTLPHWLEFLAGRQTRPSAAETHTQFTLFAQFPPLDLPEIQQIMNKTSLFFNEQRRREAKPTPDNSSGRQTLNDIR